MVFEGFFLRQQIHGVSSVPFSYLTSIGVLQFSTILTLPKVSIRFTVLITQSHKIALTLEAFLKAHCPQVTHTSDLATN